MNFYFLLLFNNLELSPSVELVISLAALHPIGTFVHWHTLAIALGRDPALVYPAVDDVLHGRICPALRKPLVVLVIAPAIGM